MYMYKGISERSLEKGRCTNFPKRTAFSLSLPPPPLRLSPLSPLSLPPRWISPWQVSSTCIPLHDVQVIAVETCMGRWTHMCTRMKPWYSIVEGSLCCKVGREVLHVIDVDTSELVRQKTELGTEKCTHVCLLPLLAIPWPDLNYLLSMG